MDVAGIGTQANLIGGKKEDSCHEPQAVKYSFAIIRKNMLLGR